jgi:GntR family transcriptional regulator
MVDREQHPRRGRPKRSADVALTGRRVLDRDSAVPLYYQLAEALKEELGTGAWQAGDRFFSEREIAEEFGVSRTVIRPALELLVGDGAIVRRRGSGAFVTPSRHEIPVAGLIKALVERSDLAITVLTANVKAPDRTVARLLEMEQEPAPVVHVTAVMRNEAQPLALLDSYAPATLVPWLLPIAQALRASETPPDPGWLELTRVRASIELTFLGSWGGPRLGASAGDPALMGRLIQFGRRDENGLERPLEFARLIVPSDSAQLLTELS